MNTSNPWQGIATLSSTLLSTLSEKKVESAAFLQGRGKQSAEPLRKLLIKPLPAARRYLILENLRKSASIAGSSAIHEASRLAVLAATNNDYLCAYFDIKITEQFRQLQAQGILFGPKSYEAMKHGKYGNINLVILAALAQFWGEPLTRFLTQDYSGLKLKPKRSTPPQKVTAAPNGTPQHLRIIYNLAAKPRP